jgi:DNA-binding winged helix-turn-helix (wHTH) protein/lipoprotein NlpI
MAPRFLVFDDLRFDLSTRELARIESGGAAVPLPIGSRAADILLLFLQRPGDLVTKNEIMSTVWSNTVVEDSNLTVQISALRRALDAGREGASAISTVPGRGYRFTLPVQEESASNDTATAAPAPGEAVASPTGAMSAATDAPAASGDVLLPHPTALARTRIWAALGAGAILVAVAAVVLHWAGFLGGHPDDPADHRATLPRQYDHALAFFRRGDFNAANAEFSELIRLDPWNKPSYLWRARARRYQGDYDGMIADAGKVIELSPDDHLGFLERGNGYLARGDLDRAIADYGTAIRITPDSNQSYFGRGLACFLSGDLMKAQADFRSSIRINSKWPPPPLWLGVLHWRGKLSGHFKPVGQAFDMAAWPTPVLRMLAGELTPAQALAAADTNDAATGQTQVCQANFYAGEIALSQGNQDEAGQLFRLAAASACASAYIERETAAAELRAQGVGR